MVSAICKELQIRKSYVSDNVKTIYFGGGTPSLLTASQLNLILESIRTHYDLAHELEITLECNPDDLTEKKLNQLRSAGVNRLSIGVQSFSQEVLTFMNRAHDSSQAEQSIKMAQNAGFDNITADLIYGVPDRSLKMWQEDVLKMIDLNVQHISAYCLTVEPNTYFGHLQNNNQLQLPADEQSLLQFEWMVNTLENAGFEHYEISNFAKEGYESKHNSSYWLGNNYLGVGPSAHSFNGESRSWNVSNNHVYNRELQNDSLVTETEHLSREDQFNEYILTRLRTKWGVDLSWVKTKLTKAELTIFNEQLNTFIGNNKLRESGDIITLTKEGKFIADYIASELFV